VGSVLSSRMRNLVPEKSHLRSGAGNSKRPRQKNSSGVKTSVMMDKGKKPNAGVISLGWAPNSLSSAPSDEAERAAEPYPVSQSQGETIAVLKDALKSERRATEEAEARCKLLMSEKEALLESLRAAQDKILAYASGLSIN